MNTGKILVFSAPSGTGKTTLVKYIMTQIENLHFSVSATSRQPRGKEQHGIDYYFMQPDEFREHINKGDFLEYEEVYHDKFYGTLRSEVERQLHEGRNVVLDIDVKGAINVKRIYQDQALTLFIQPPSIETLRQRLINRGTDTMEVINDRIAKAEYEISFAHQFDRIVINDVLEQAEAEVLNIVSEYLQA